MTRTNEAAVAALVEALERGDYPAALAAYRDTDNARTTVGRPTEAMLLALAGDHTAAARAIAGCDAGLIELFVRGERERAARWTDRRAARVLRTPVPAEAYAPYAALALGFVAGDAKTIEREALPAVRAIPPVGGTLRLVSGDTVRFISLVDSDDAIGAMLECYEPDGLTYVPMAALRRVQFLPGRNFLDRFMPRAELEFCDGTQATMVVPLLYAGSTLAKDEAIRTGAMTTWSYVGGARRALGQRDVVVNGGKMIGLERVAAIEFDAVATAAGRAAPAPPRAPLPTARVPDLRPRILSPRTTASLGIAAIVLLLLLLERSC